MLEILAPAGNAQCADAAINNGANAIYLGYSSFSARQSADNFDEAGLLSVVKRAHFCGVKVYVAMNTVVKDSETEFFIKTLLSVWACGVDAIIMQDLLFGKALKKRYPELILHASTQAGICNVNGAIFAKDCGFSRVILARETPLEEIRKITQIIETEVFVQGALCTCFSGQCYFSSFAGGNSGNRGRCKQPCRKLYAYDRNGNTEKSYALSLADLCVGEDIQKYMDAGVSSFKIEGRLRRAEYVGAAVNYYRTLLDKRSGADKALSALKRTFNRGNYTKGLAFGQDKKFLSTAVQGHIGEKVGVVKVTHGQYFVESVCKVKNGDAFKILREGKEVGGAIFSKAENKGFVILSKTRLKNGDGVFITTDTSVNEQVLSVERKGELSLRLYFTVGERPAAEADGLLITGDNVLQPAQNRPITKEEIKANFEKTDGLPVNVTFEEILLQGEIFMPKAELNAFRRKVYAEIADRKARQGHTLYPFISFDEKINGENHKTAIIADDFTDIDVDIAVFKPNDYRAPLPTSFINGKFEKYVYYPAYALAEDEQAILAWLNETNVMGIYAENYAGAVFSIKHNLKIFAGTGWNLTNKIAVAQCMQMENMAYYSLSKELNEGEAKPLVSEKAFALASGNIKLMELCYCPFGKTCHICDKKSIYALTDEQNRVFPTRRYLDGKGNCRFEVYNCADLIGLGIKNAGKIADFTLVIDKSVAYSTLTDENAQKNVYKNYTSGHAKRGVL